MRIETYYNLKYNCPAVRALETPDKYRVIAYPSLVVVLDASFVVRESGRRRAIREGYKNVHAFCRGEWGPDISETTFLRWRRVKYDPFRYPYFYLACNGARVDRAEVVAVSTRGCYARGTSSDRRA